MIENAKQYSDFSAPRADGIEYMLTVGRRQPMHAGHLRTIQRIMEEGYKPIIVIGSANSAEKVNGLADPLFEPVSNPLTAEQRREQIRLALPGKVEGKDYFVFDFPDLGDNEKWCKGLAELLHGQVEIDGKYPDISKKTAFHFIGREEDKRPKRFVSPDGTEREALAYGWEGIFDRLGLPVLQDTPHEKIGLEVSGTRLRQVDLNHMSPDERALFAAPDHVRALANEARARNPDRDALANIPVTALDLSLDRLAAEKGITQASVIARAASSGEEVTLGSLAAAARELNGSLKAEKTVPIKIASASLNQTVYDFATNVPNILAAIDKAVQDKADILALEELGLTGYPADDYHQWNKANAEVWKHIQLIAAYAAKKDPNLVISLGTPWHYADKTLNAGDAAYNINNRPYNTQMTITGGKVVAIAAKSILADGPAEYEPRQFRNWPFEKGTQAITLPDGSAVPFGKPIVALEKGGQRITLSHEICAEGWPGVNDDLTVNAREQNQVRPIARQSLTHDLSVVLNPSASKPQPAINKERIRAQGLCESGSKYCGAFVYTNYLGSGSGTYAAEGSQIYAQDGKTIHHGQRYNFSDVSYSSAVLNVPVARRGAPDVTVSHDFQDHKAGFTGKEADFEKVTPDSLIHEEYARSISLWLRDYMSKQPWCQGFVISLSGGKDSAYGAAAISAMVDLEIKENGIEGFFKHFPKLKYKDEAFGICKKKGEEAAVDAIKRNLLTCVYMPTENSSERTLNAAKFLIEGGEIDGRKIKGIGGNFYVAHKQRVLDEEVVAYSGLDIDKVARDNLDTIIGTFPNKDALLKLMQDPAFADIARTQLEDIAKAQIIRSIKEYINAKPGSSPVLPDYISRSCVKAIPTWSNPADDTTLQNIQARIRLPTPWTVANKEGKIALVTSNESEAVLGYTTAGGDMHMGGANPIGGMPKDDITQGLVYFEQHGLAGLPPVEALHYVNLEKASAELRKIEEGAIEQTDETDLGFSYAQSKIMENTIVEGRHTPKEAFIMLKADPLFPDDSVLLRNMLLEFTNRWGTAQFKRIMGALAPHVGDNVDPHQSVRTTVLGDHFRTGMAQLSVDVLAEKLGGERGFQSRIRMTPEEASHLASIDKEFKAALLEKSFELLVSKSKSGELTALAAQSPMYEVMQDTAPAKASRLSGYGDSARAM